MKHVWKGAPALVLFGASVVASSPGCVEAEAPFFVLNAKRLTCDALTPDSNNLPSGLLDLRYKCEYDAVLELGNQLVRRGDETKLQIETSRISVTRFDVEVMEADETVITRIDGTPAQFSYPTAGFVNPATSGAPGRGLAATLLIDGGTAQALAKRFLEGDVVSPVIARVVAHGRTLGGDDVTSRPWDFPIELTYGKLCSCNPDSTSTEQCTFLQDSGFSCELVNGDCSSISPCYVPN